MGQPGPQLWWMPSAWLRQYDEGECEHVIHLFKSEQDFDVCSPPGWQLLSESGGKLLEPRGMDIQYLMLIKNGDPAFIGYTI